MKTILSGYFDVGFSIGIDDTFFYNDPVKILAIDLPVGFKYVPNDKVSSEFSTVKLGQGLSFDITESSIFTDWKRGAFEIANSNSYYLNREISEYVITEIKELISSNISYNLLLTVFSCGVGLIEFSFDEMDEKKFPESYMRFLQTFENAAYCKFESKTTFHAELQKNSQKILESFILEGDLIPQISLRIKRKDDQFNCQFFPGFTILFFSPNLAFCNALRKHREDQRSDIFSKSSLGNSIVWCSWYILIEKKGNEEYESTLLQIIRIYSLFYGLCQFYSNLLYDKISELLYSHNHQKDEWRSLVLSKIQILSLAYINYTDILNITLNIEIQEILDNLNKQGKISHWHEGMSKSVIVLSNIQKEIDNTIYNKLKQREKERDDNISKFIAVITTFTFVSVIVDFLNLDQLSSKFLPHIYMRLMLYFIIFGIILGVLLKLFNRHKK